MLIPLKYNFRSLAVRRLNTILTAFSIAMTVAVFITVLALAEGIDDTFVSSGSPLNILVLRQGAQSDTNSIVPREVAQSVRTLPGIAQDGAGSAMFSAERIIFIDLQRRETGSSNVVIRGVGSKGRELRPAARLVSGRWFRPGARELTVSRAIADRFMNCEIGDEVRTGRSRWRIVGIFDAGQSAFGSEIWTDADDVGNAFNRIDYSLLLLRADGRASIKPLQGEIESDRRASLAAMREIDYYADQTKSAAPIRIVGNIIAIIMAIGAAFAAMNTMYATVAARIHEVAVLRAIGFSPRSVLLSFLVESLVLSFFGGVLGILFALPVDGLATGTTNWFSFSEMAFQFRITPPLLLRGLGFSLLMGAIGGILAALRASRQSVARVLRA